MTIFYGYKRLAKSEDWKELAGDENWVPGQSAYELARSWQAAGGFPPGIAKAIADCKAMELKGLRLEAALVEKPAFLDTQVAPSTAYLMGYARNAAAEPVILAVEGKAKETFGPPVRSWLRSDAIEFPRPAQPLPARTRRFEFLCSRLGFGVDLECQLRYQLLHRTVAAVTEAELRTAAAAVVLVHVFGSDSNSNWKDFELFLEALGSPSPSVGKMTGPIPLGSQRRMPTFFLWWQDAQPGTTN